MAHEQPTEKRAANALQEHARIRAVLADTRALAQRLASGDAEAAPLLRELLRHLSVLLELHKQEEDRTIAPILEHIDAWGKERQRILADEHAHERRVMARLEGADLAQAEQLLAVIGKSADEIEAGLTREEELAVNPDLLRDDPIRVEQFDG